MLLSGRIRSTPSAERTKTAARVLATMLSMSSRVLAFSIVQKLPAHDETHAEWQAEWQAQAE